MKDTTKAQITMYSPDDEQLEAMLNPRADAAAKAHAAEEAAQRKAVRRITRPVRVMLALTVVFWLVNVLALAGIISAVAADAVNGGCIVVTLVVAVVVTVRVMGGVGNAG